MNIPTLPARITPAYVAKARNELLSTCKPNEPLRLNAQGLVELNGLAIAFFAGLQRDAKAKGSELILVGLSENFAKSLEHVADLSPPPPQPKPIPLFEKVGDQTLHFISELKDTLLLFSESIYGSTWGLIQRKTIPKGEVITQMIRLGSSALPIVLLLSLLIGFTLAVQSGNQLQQYGATIFLADGLGVGMVTEIGPVLTAVIVAGRSGSAITAEIATMTVQEEIAALQTMAVNPIQFLVLPRFWALSLALPLLTALAAASGILSGLIIGFVSFNLSPQSYLAELGQAVLPYYFVQMLIKSLTFGWIIALVAVTKGLRVSGGADAVGRATTACVVTCIFSIIVADALFSFLFYYF